MKKIYFFILLVAMSLLSYSAMAQSVLVVEPGIGTLNAAVAANGGNKIYQLKAGEWYGLNAPIVSNGFHLQIIGGEPAEKGGLPATLQTGSNVNGEPFRGMLHPNGAITIKNIYFVNADLSGQVANHFLIQSAENARITVDNCILHPVGIETGILSEGGFSKVYFTNNLVVNHGHQLSPNDGNFFHFENASTGGPDTVLVENNTFVCMGMSMLKTGFAKFHDTNFIMWNHNTFVMTKSQIDWSVAEQEYFWTNNLMFNVQTQPYFNHWQPMPGGDPARPKPNLIFTDKLPGETLPSARINFVQYNSHYRAQGFYDFLNNEVNPYAIANNKPGAYLFPLVWPADSVNCREAQMFNSEGFPLFKYGNTITDLNPEWTDSRIYEHEARLIEWTKPATMIHGFGLPNSNYPPATQWPQWHWIPSGDISDNSVWPLFDGTYKNTKTLSGSIENLPLGDLNWFPEAKAKWEAQKDEILAHMKSGNTEKFILTSVKPQLENGKFKMYPNPAQNVLNFDVYGENNISIHTVDGSRIRAARNVSKVDISDLNNGIYFVTVQEGVQVSTQKLIIEK
jgi:hypothetical protein